MVQFCPLELYLWGGLEVHSFLVWVTFRSRGLDGGAWTRINEILKSFFRFICGLLSWFVRGHWDDVLSILLKRAIRYFCYVRTWCCFCDNFSLCGHVRQPHTYSWMQWFQRSCLVIRVKVLLQSVSHLSFFLLELGVVRQIETVVQKLPPISSLAGLHWSSRGVDLYSIAGLPRSALCKSCTT